MNQRIVPLAIIILAQIWFCAAALLRDSKWLRHQETIGDGRLGVGSKSMDESPVSIETALLPLSNGALHRNTLFNHPIATGDPKVRKKRWFWRSSDEEITTKAPKNHDEETTTKKSGWRSWFSKAASSAKRAYKVAKSGLKKVKDAAKRKAKKLVVKISGVIAKIRRKFTRTDDKFAHFANNIKKKVEDGDEKALDLLEKLGIQVGYDSEGHALNSTVNESVNITEVLKNEGILAIHTNETIAEEDEEDKTTATKNTTKLDTSSRDPTFSTPLTTPISSTSITTPSHPSTIKMGHSSFSTSLNTPIYIYNSTSSKVPSSTITVRPTSSVILANHTSTIDIKISPTISEADLIAEIISGSSAPDNGTSDTPIHVPITTKTPSTTTTTPKATEKLSTKSNPTTSSTIPSTTLSTRSTIIPTTTTTTSPPVTSTTPPPPTTTSSPETPTTSVTSSTTPTSTTPPTTTSTTPSTTYTSYNYNYNPTTTAPPSTTTSSSSTTPTTSSRSTTSTASSSSTTTTSSTTSTTTTADPMPAPEEGGAPPPFPDIFGDSKVRERLHEVFMNSDFNHEDLRTTFDFDPALYEDYYSYYYDL